MTLVVLGFDILRDARFELLEHIGKVGFLIAGGLFFRDDHARVLRHLVVAQPIAKVHERVIARGRRLRWLCRLCGRRGFHRACRAGCGFLLRGWRLRRRFRHRAQRRLRAEVVRRQLEHALIDRSGLVHLTAAKQRVGKREVRFHELRTIVRSIGVLDALLVVLHRSRIDTHDLVRHRHRGCQIAAALVPRHCGLELTDSALAVSRFEHCLCQFSPRRPIFRIAFDHRLQHLDGFLRDQRRRPRDARQRLLFHANVIERRVQQRNLG